MRLRSSYLIAIGILLGVALTLTVGFLNRPYTYQGSLIDPPTPAADFELTDANGKPFRFSDQRGKTALIFFGYTDCPDVCPVTLTEFKRVRAGLGNQAEQVNFIFITVDPERDTPERLKSHVANYDPNIIALTGSQAELEPVWKAYWVYREKVENDGATGYLIDHTARVYVVDKQGNLRLTFPFGMETQAMLEDVQHVIQGD
jgi:protein SCO1/2